METVTITGLDRVRAPKPSDAGHTILAYFSADVGVFNFKGCVLVRTARQGIAAWLPKLDDKRAHNQRSVTLNDEPTRNAILKAAREMYILMGGKDADWRSRDDDDDDAVIVPQTAEQPASGRVTVEVRRRVITSDTGEDREGLATFLGSKDDN